MQHKTRWIFYLSALAILWAGLTLNAQNRHGDGWGAKDHYWRMYNPDAVETLSGTVVKAEPFTARKGMPDGFHIQLKNDQETIWVHLGPAWFIQNQEQSIAAKDQISVTGSRVKYEGRMVMMAASITKGEDVMVLRQEDGFPVWAGWRKGQGRQHHGLRGHGKGMGQGKGCQDCQAKQALINGQKETFQGEIIEVQRVDARKNNFKGIHLLVKTEAEAIPVQLGPEWYLVKENAVFSNGDQVVVEGVRNSYDGKPAILAATIRRGDNSWTLRDAQGLPAWRGWRQGARAEQTN